MVQEYRRIILSTDDLIKAFNIYRKVAPEFMPEGTITRCVAHDYGAIRVIIEVTQNNRSRLIHLSLQASDCLKPVIAFCLDNEIPLPRDGRKSVDIQRGAVVLLIALAYKVAPAEALDTKKSIIVTQGSLLEGPEEALLNPERFS